MKQYYVRIPFTGYMDFTVQAESEEEAKAAAFDAEFALIIEKKEAVEVEMGEWSLHEKIVQGNVFYGTINEIEIEEEELED